MSSSHGPPPGSAGALLPACALVMLLLLAGCGSGGGGGAGGTDIDGRPLGGGTGSLVVVVQPLADEAGGPVIAMSIGSIRVRLEDPANPGRLLVRERLARSDAQAGTPLTVSFPSVRGGPVLVRVSAFADATGSGAALTAGSATGTVAAGQENVIEIRLSPGD